MEVGNPLVRITESQKFHAFILLLIGINAIVLAVEAIPSAKAYFRSTFTQIDTIILWWFVAGLTVAGNTFCIRRNCYTSVWGEVSRTIW